MFVLYTIKDICNFQTAAWPLCMGIMVLGNQAIQEFLKNYVGAETQMLN